MSGVSDYDTTASNNTPAGTESIRSGDDQIRQMKADIASYTRAGADLASESTLNLDSVDSLWFPVTGTVTVTAVTLTEGHFRLVRAADALPLTASANLVVNGQTSGTYYCTPGDELTFRGLSGSVVDVHIAGRPSPWEFLGRRTISGTPTAIDYAPADLDTTKYVDFQFFLRGVRPTTDDDGLIARFGQGSGPSYVASSYQWGVDVAGPGGGTTDGSTTILTTALGISRLGVGGKLGNATGEGFYGQILLRGPAIASQYRTAEWNGTAITPDGTMTTVQGSGGILDTTVTTAFRLLLLSGGTFAAGVIDLYGRRIPA